MEKIIQFSNEQKNLIWKTKVAPQGGTLEECELFIEVSETHGLNPLVGDIVFQKYETKRGPAINFITTRDGYLKAAMRDKDYIKVVSAVVKEGDHFAFDIVNGSVDHRFGAQRGKIQGAWAVAEHRTRGRLPVFVDFEEYFRANAYSQGGKSPIWDKMPSAMIQKVAEVFVLRRQFPLGGIVTAEEMGVDGIGEQEPISEKEQLFEQPSEKTEILPKESENLKQTNVQMPNQNGESKFESQSNDKQSFVNNEQINDNLVDENPQKQEFTEKQQEEVKPDVGNQQQKENQQTTDQSQVVPADNNILNVRFESIKAGTSPSGKAFAKCEVSSQEKGRLLLLCKGEEKVALVNAIKKGDVATVKISETNDYYFIEDILSIEGAVS